MLLWMSSGHGERLVVGCCLGDDVEHFAGDEAFEAADDVLLGQSFGSASAHVGLGARVPAQAAENDPVQRSVCLPVAAAVEAVAVLSLIHISEPTRRS